MGLKKENKLLEFQFLFISKENFGNLDCCSYYVRATWLSVGYLVATHRHNLPSLLFSVPAWLSVKLCYLITLQYRVESSLWLNISCLCKWPVSFSYWYISLSVLVWNLGEMRYSTFDGSMLCYFFGQEYHQCGFISYSIS